jgi:hypothetical protein
MVASYRIDFLTRQFSQKPFFGFACHPVDLLQYFFDSENFQTQETSYITVCLQSFWAHWEVSKEKNRRLDSQHFSSVGS